MQLAANRARRIGLIALAVLALLVLVALLFPWNLVRGPVASIIGSRLQRPVTIGHLDLHWGSPIRIQLDDLVVGNASWSKTQPMATFPSMILNFRLFSLLRMTPDTIALTRPDVLLERNDAGDVNWHFADAAGHMGSAFGAIDIEGGNLRYRDSLIPASIDATLQTDAAVPSRPLRFAGKGTLRGEAFEMEGTSAGVDEMRRIDAPYHLALKGRAGRTALEFDGTAVPSRLENMQGELHLKGPDLSKLYPIVPTPLPWTPPYDLTGNLSHAKGVWTFKGIHGTVGDSDIAGEFTVDRTSGRPSTVANLTSKKFDYNDLGGFVGRTPTPARAASSGRSDSNAHSRPGRVFPDHRFNLVRLRDHDVDVHFTGRSVKWGPIPIDELVTHIVLKDGVMNLDPLDFGLADGHVVAHITLDATKDVPSAQAKIEARNVELKRVFPKLASPNGSAGRFGGRAQFHAHGASIAELFASADGDAAVAMRGGEASTLRLVLTNLDLARAAQLLIGGDETASIHCAVAAMHAKNGVLTPELMTIDTSAELITGTGDIDFRNETYNLRLKADSKKPSIFALKGPIVIGGTFRSPTAGPEVASLLARIGASVGLGAVAGPLALLPLIDLGDAPDADCKALYQDARVKSGTAQHGVRAAPATNHDKRGKATTTARSKSPAVSAAN